MKRKWNTKKIICFFLVWMLTGNYFVPMLANNAITVVIPVDTESKDKEAQVNEYIVEQLKKGKVQKFQLPMGTFVLKGTTISALVKQNCMLEFQKGLVEVRFPSSVLKGLNIKESDSVTLSIQPIEFETDPLPGSSETEGETLNIVGAEVGIMQNDQSVERVAFPYQIAIQYDILQDHSVPQSALTGFRYGTGKMEQLGGKVEGDDFVYQTNKTGTFSVYYSNTLKTLEMKIDEKQYTFNGVAETMEMPPFIENNRTMVPLRFVATALGGKVSWEPDTKTVMIQLEDKTIQLQGEDIVLRNDRSFVPLRRVAEDLNANVIWDEDTKNITIYY